MALHHRASGSQVTASHSGSPRPATGAVTSSVAALAASSLADAADAEAPVVSDGDVDPQRHPHHGHSTAHVIEQDQQTAESVPNTERSPPAVIHTGRWTQEEHQAFLVGLKLYGREWKKVAQQIKTRSSAQIRSHAQKYFAKLSKAEFEGRAYDHEWLTRCVESTLSALWERRRQLEEQRMHGGVAPDATASPFTSTHVRSSSDEDGGASDTSSEDPSVGRKQSAKAASTSDENSETEDLRARRQLYRFASGDESGSGGSGCSSWSSSSLGTELDHTPSQPHQARAPAKSSSSPTLSIESLDDGELVALQVLCGSSNPPRPPVEQEHRHSTTLTTLHNLEQPPRKHPRRADGRRESKPDQRSVTTLAVSRDSHSDTADDRAPTPTAAHDAKRRRLHSAQCGPVAAQPPPAYVAAAEPASSLVAVAVEQPDGHP